MSTASPAGGAKGEAAAFGGEAREQSPWAEPKREDPKQRVVGWRAGVSLTVKGVHDILKRDKRSRHDYRGLRAATGPTKKGADEASDPLAGLPPTWQAFWSTVPHLDPQAAYRQFRHEQQRRSKNKDQATQAARRQEEDEEEEADLEEETARLDEEVRRKKQLLAEKQKQCSEWDRKFARVRLLDRDEGELSRRVHRRVESASYAYGILEGKLRSSDIYFQFLHEDTKIAHKQKVLSLTRSNTLMGKQIDGLKGEVRMLLKAAAEAHPSSDADADPLQSSEKKRSGESTEDKKATADVGSSSSVHSHQRVTADATASSSPSARPAPDPA